jgi:hypothetical protein
MYASGSITRHPKLQMSINPTIRIQYTRIQGWDIRASGQSTRVAVV